MSKPPTPKDRGFRAPAESEGCHYSKLFGLEKGIEKGDKCIKCGKDADILLPYGPQKFCKKHFLELIESRFKKTIRQNSLFKAGERLVIAVSGGKDSLTALYLTQKFFSKSNKITALLINEGIPGYRDRALMQAKKNCKQWSIGFKEFSFKEEFGYSMKEIQKALLEHPEKNLGSPCTFCGTLRRNLLNKGARSLKADKLLTGHNLDDETQSILMNACDNDFNRFLRSGAKSGVMERSGLVQRIKPLCEVPERETFFFAKFKGIEFYSGECCPLSGKAKRNDYRLVLNHLEEQFPGTKFSLWRFFNQIKPMLAEREKFTKVKLDECRECGEPCSNELCEACKKIGVIEELM